MVVNATNDKIVISTKENELTAEKKPSVLDGKQTKAFLFSLNNTCIYAI